MYERLRAYVRELVDRLIEWCSRNERNRGVPGQSMKHWHLSVLLDVDEAARTVKPIVCVDGPIIPVEAWLFLQATCPRKGIRLLTYLPHAHRGSQTELAFGEVAVPTGSSMDEVARWRWKVVLGASEGALASHEGFLVAAGRMNAEAELSASR